MVRSAQSHRHVVLVVDDYTELQEAATMLLETMGYVAIRADSGPEALALLRAGHRPCLMLLDVCMPGMTGFELRTAIADDPMLHDIPVVLMSGDPVELARDGHANVMAKPFEPRALVATIERHAHCRTTAARALASRAAATPSDARVTASAPEHTASVRDRAARFTK